MTNALDVSAVCGSRTLEDIAVRNTVRLGRGREVVGRGVERVRGRGGHLWSFDFAYKEGNHTIDGMA